MKHTKGEWKCISTSSDKHDKINVVSLDIDEPASICEINRFGFGLDWIKESEANAKLIAAAPDLLEACIKGIDGLDNGEYNCDQVAQFLHEAIKKATE